MSEPNTKEERYLASISGEYNDGLHEPITKKERYLYNIAENGRGDVSKQVAEEVAKVVADAPEEFDTLKEMSDWIYQHEDSAAAMNSAILKNKEDIASLQTGKADVDIVEEVNSNLSELEYSDVSGGKNLANINNFKALTINEGRYGYEWLNMKGGTYTFNITNGANTLYIGYKYNDSFVNPSYVLNGSKVQTITIPDGADIVLWYGESVKTNTVTKLQLEVGDTATDYEPYIPSVKMLADEVNAQNDSLGEYNLTAKDNIWESGTLDSSGNEVENTNITRTKFIPCKKVVRVIKTYTLNTYVFEYTDSDFIKSTMIGSGLDITFTLSSECTRIRLLIGDNIDNVINRTTVFADNAIDEIKNDLLPKKGNWGDIAGSVIDGETLKTSLLSNISKYNNGDTVNYKNNAGQKGVFLISKTDDDYFTALFISGGFGYNAIFTYQSGTWDVKAL